MEENRKDGKKEPVVLENFKTLGIVHENKTFKEYELLTDEELNSLSKKDFEYRRILIEEITSETTNRLELLKISVLEQLLNPKDVCAIKEELDSKGVENE